MGDVPNVVWALTVIAWLASTFELMDHHDVGEVVHAGPAQLLRPGNTEQAEVGHLSHVVPGELAGEVVTAGARLHDLLREVAHHVAHLEVMIGEVEGVVHGRNIAASGKPTVSRCPLAACVLRLAPILSSQTPPRCS